MSRTLWAAGLGILAAAKTAHTLRGYRTPRPPSTQDAATYDARVVREWIEALQRWSPTEDLVARRHVLELGPGPDLGTGLLLLGMHGAASYTAVDVHPLALGDRGTLYDDLATFCVEQSATPPQLVLDLREEVLVAAQGKSTPRIEYVVDPDFNLALTPGYDLIVSQAAFEHFDDPIGTLRRVTALAEPGAVLCIAVDFSTHGRWIREKDPLNIYRYPDWLYRLLTFRGSPNRVPLSAYTEALWSLGWSEVQAITDHAVPDWPQVRRTLHPQYRGEDRKHRYAVILARKS